MEFEGTIKRLESASVLNAPSLRGRDINAPSLSEFVHELRQPLSAIDSLAYYLEMISTDENVRCHLQQIQAMVLKTHHILDRAVPADLAAHSN